MSVKKDCGKIIKERCPLIDYCNDFRVAEIEVCMGQIGNYRYCGIYRYKEEQDETKYLNRQILNF
jgi:hypothetical protein